MSLTITKKNIVSYKTGERQERRGSIATPSNVATRSRYHPVFGHCVPSSLLTEERMIPRVWQQIRRDPLITKIEWRAGPLSTKVLLSFPNLKELICLNNGLTSLCKLTTCTKLEVLNCSLNKLVTLEGLEQCNQLHTIYCYGNTLTHLTGLENCLHLHTLNCSENMLITLDAVKGCTQLRELECSCNKLVSLTSLANCQLLEELDCSYNKITNLCGLELCTKLRILECCNNELASVIHIAGCQDLTELDVRMNVLTSLAGLEDCSSLTKLNCFHNQLTSLQPVVYLKGLRRFEYSVNPLASFSIQVKRYVDRFGRGDKYIPTYTGPHIRNQPGQKRVCELIQSLLLDPEPTFTEASVTSSSLDAKTITTLLEYCRDEAIHPDHLLTYQELLGYVWARMQVSPLSPDLFKVLSANIASPDCKYLAGRFDRTLAVLMKP